MNLIEKAQALGLSVSQVAIGIQQQGCPRTKDVRAAKNAIYLAKHGKSGGLDLAAATKVAMQYDDFQAATRLLARPPYVGPQRARYKRQQRPA